MKVLPLITCALTVLAAAMPISHRAHAAAGIQRCESGNGTVVYTDRSCALLDAKAVPMSGELVSRIASERMRERDPDALTGLTTTSGLPPVGRRSLTSGCAKTATQLALDLRGALALNNVNRVAESYHWVGHSHQQAQPLLGRLDRLSRKQLLDIEYFNAQIGPAGIQLADASGMADGVSGIMQLSFAHGAAVEVVDFRVRRYAGCYFVQF